MVKTVGLEMRWLPKEIGSLFVKGIGIESIEYWYNAIMDSNRQA